MRSEDPAEFDFGATEQASTANFPTNVPYLYMAKQHRASETHSIQGIQHPGKLTLAHYALRLSHTVRHAPTPFCAKPFQGISSYFKGLQRSSKQIFYSGPRTDASAHCPQRSACLGGSGDVLEAILGYLASADKEAGPSAGLVN